MRNSYYNNIIYSHTMENPCRFNLTSILKFKQSIKDKEKSTCAVHIPFLSVWQKGNSVSGS